MALRALRRLVRHLHVLGRGLGGAGRLARLLLAGFPAEKEGTQELEEGEHDAGNCAEEEGEHGPGGGW